MPSDTVTAEAVYMRIGLSPIRKHALPYIGIRCGIEVCSTSGSLAALIGHIKKNQESRLHLGAGLMERGFISCPCFVFCSNCN